MSEQMHTSDTKAFQASVVRMIETGQYFKDAQEWYAQVYLAPATQRSFMVIVMAAIVMAAFLTITSVDNLLPLTERAPFVTWSRTSEEYYPELKPLSDQNENIEHMVARYFISKYIQDRETYLPRNEEVQRARYSRVLAQSAKRVRRDYEQSIFASSANSFEQRYGRSFKREVRDIDVKFSHAGARLGEAEVHFTTEVIPLGQREGKQQRWAVKVNFAITDMEAVLEKTAPLRLLVRDYALSEVTG
jgi:type IV secretory pathway component VirB8